jgi:hypothetical protein
LSDFFAVEVGLVVWTVTQPQFITSTYHINNQPLTKQTIAFSFMCNFMIADQFWNQIKKMVACGDD